MVLSRQVYWEEFAGALSADSVGSSEVCKTACVLCNVCSPGRDMLFFLPCRASSGAVARQPILPFFGWRRLGRTQRGRRGETWRQKRHFPCFTAPHSHGAIHDQTRLSAITFAHPLGKNRLDEGYSHGWVALCCVRQQCRLTRKTGGDWASQQRQKTLFPSVIPPLCARSRLLIVLAPLLLESWTLDLPYRRWYYQRRRHAAVQKFQRLSFTGIANATGWSMLCIGPI